MKHSTREGLSVLRTAWCWAAQNHMQMFNLNRVVTLPLGLAILLAGCALNVIPVPQTGAYRQEVALGREALPVKRLDRPLFPHRTDLLKQKPDKNAMVLVRFMPSIPLTYGPVDGAIDIRLIIEADGSVHDAEVASSCGRPEIDDLYAAAVRRWVYSPAMLDGKPVPQLVRQPFLVNLK